MLILRQAPWFKFHCLHIRILDNRIHFIMKLGLLIFIFNVRLRVGWLLLAFVIFKIALLF